MQYTTHYNLNLPEGTDIVNPLVQDNPNYTAIDSAMFANKQSVIGSATEIVSGTVHAITRLNPDSNYFRFTATGNWTAGDSMSVDGVNVSVYLSDGTTPATGSYIINTEVLAILSGSRVTLILSSGAVDASAVSYDNSGSGLTATNVQDAIDEIVPKGSVSVIGDGIKSYGQLLTELYGLVDITKITVNSTLLVGASVLKCSTITATVFAFSLATVSGTSDLIIRALLNTGEYALYASGVYTDATGNIPGAGTVVELTY